VGCHSGLCGACDRQPCVNVKEIAFGHGTDESLKTRGRTIWLLVFRRTSDA
jgi:hypothetical protein